MRVRWRRRAAGAVWGERTPVGRNPRSATRLKMAGRRSEQQAVERLGKPVDGAVAGGVESAGVTRGNLGHDRQIDEGSHRSMH